MPARAWRREWPRRPQPRGPRRNPINARKGIETAAWQNAAFAASAVSPSGRLHADMTVGIRRRVGRMMRQLARDFFTSPKGPRNPGGPGIPPWKRWILAGSLTTFLLAACAPGDTQPSPTAHPATSPPSPVPTFVPLPSNTPALVATQTLVAPVGTPFPEYWHTSDFPVVAAIYSDEDPAIQQLITLKYQAYVLPDLIRIEAALSNQGDPRCKDLSCEAR